jgi:hypothetical protein
MSLGLEMIWRSALPSKSACFDETTLSLSLSLSPNSNTRLDWLFAEIILLTYSSTGHVFRRQAAGAFGPDLSKKLSQLVKMEKNVMRSMELVGRERMEVAVGCALPQ